MPVTVDLTTLHQIRDTLAKDSSTPWWCMELVNQMMGFAIAQEVHSAKFDDLQDTLDDVQNQLLSLRKQYSELLYKLSEKK